MSRGTQALINLKNLKHNFKLLKKLAPNKLVLVVKANAYGHGLKHIVQALDDVDCFAVATIQEALLIRKYSPKVRVLLLEGVFNLSELKLAFKHDFDCVIHQNEQLDLLTKIVSQKKINLWLKYDSGMNRLGFDDEGLVITRAKLKHNNNVNEIIYMSHLASANLTNSQFTQKQTKRFLAFKDLDKISLSNSSALLNDYVLADEWCRVGLALFGVSPIENTMANDFGLKPVMTLKTNVIAIKHIKAGQSVGYTQAYTAKTDRTIAIIGIGYGDGYPWALTKSAYVMLNNKKAKIIGRVSMDMMTIDITGIKNVTVGKSVLIWGKSGESQLPIETVASHAQNIPYVLLCQLTSRVINKYVKT